NITGIFGNSLRKLNLIWLTNCWDDVQSQTVPGTGPGESISFLDTFNKEESMKGNKFFAVLGLAVIVSMVLTACGAPATALPPTAAPNTVATKASMNLTETAAAPEPTSAP